MKAFHLKELYEILSAVLFIYADLWVSICVCVSSFWLISLLRQANTYLERMNSLIYLASPYTHEVKDVAEDVVQHRMRIVNKCAADLAKRGYFIYSPLSMWHEVAISNKLPTDWRYWKETLEIILNCCNALLVIVQPGWESSTGVKAEIEYAKQLNIRIGYFLPSEIDQNTKYLQTFLSF